MATYTVAASDPLGAILQRDDAQERQAKEELLRRAGLENRQTFDLGPNGSIPSDELLQFARILALQSPEVRAQEVYTLPLTGSPCVELVSVRSEVFALTLLLQALPASTHAHLQHRLDAHRPACLVVNDSAAPAPDGHRDVALASHSPHTGGGGCLVAARAMPAGSAILRVPEGRLMNVRAANGSPTCGAALSEIEGLDETTVLILFILHERFVRGSASPWADYLAHLPTGLDNSLFWSDPELALLQGSSARDEAKVLRAQLERAHGTLFPVLSDYYPDVFPAEACTLERFLWARAILDSRALSFLIDGQLCACLVPVGDDMNHAVPAHVTRRQFDNQQRELIFYTNHALAEGEEILLQYGPLQDRELLLYYGFVIPDNPFSRISLELAPPKDKSAAIRLRELERRGLSTEQFITVGSLSERLLETLRILLCGKTELAAVMRMDASERPVRLGLQLEGTIMATLRRVLQGLLDGYPPAKASTGTSTRAALAAALVAQERSMLAVALAQATQLDPLG